MGVRTVGEKALKQQPLFRQRVEVRRDIARTTQRTDRMACKTFHQDHHHVLDRQRLLCRWRGVATHRGGIGIDQLVVFGQQHVTHCAYRDGVFKRGLPDVGALV